MSPHDSPTSAINPSAAPSPRPANTAQPLPPRLADARVGPYHLLRILGEGGFGVVYLAERREPFVQPVALKVLKPGMDSQAILTRFELERQALALMDHPGIAKVLDGGLTDDSSRLGPGRPYFVMELVRGDSITEYCRANALSVHKRLELFIAVCDAVQHAHIKGVIHRDLKPSNILVTEVGGKPIPKVIDFGVAKAISTLKPEQTMTVTGQFIGTPEYMSPEQAGGGAGVGSLDNADIDTRADVYSLGVILYRLLTGVLPFEPDELWKRGLLETMRVIREVEPPKPSTRVATESKSRLSAANAPTAIGVPAPPPLQLAEPSDTLARKLRGDLDWICMRALEKPRDRRYQSPGALAADIRRHLRTEPVEAGPPDLSYRVGKFVKRRKALVAAATLAICALIIGFVMAVYGLTEARRQRDIAVGANKTAQLEKTAADLARGQAEANFITAERQRRQAETSLTFIRRAALLAGPAMRQDFTLRDLVNQMDRDLAADSANNDPETRIALLLLVGDLQRSLGELQSARKNLTEAADQLRARGQTGDITFARALIDLARVCNDQNDPRRALVLTTEVLPSLRASTDPEAPMYLGRALTASGLAYQKLGRRDESIAALREGTSLIEARIGEAHYEMVNPLCVLALTLCESPSGRAEAVDTARRAVQIAAIGDQNDTLDIAAHSALGRTLRESGDLNAAAAAYGEALARTQLLPDLPPATTASVQINLAQVLRELGRLDQAAELTARAIATRRRIAPASPDLADALDIAGLIASERAVQVDGANGGWTDHPETLAAAEAAFREELDILTQPDIGNPVTAARPETFLADVLNRQGQFEPALGLAEKALATRRKSLGAGDWRTLNTQTVVAASMAGMGRFEEAEPLLLAALDGLRADPATTPARLRPPFRRAIAVYRGWNKPDPMSHWQAELDKLPPVAR